MPVSFFSSLNFCVVLVSAYYMEQVTIDMFQIAYFCTKYYIFWVRERTKSVITEAYTKRRVLFTLKTAPCAAIDTSHSTFEYLMPNGISALAHLQIFAMAAHSRSRRREEVVGAENAITSGRCKAALHDMCTALKCTNRCMWDGTQLMLLSTYNWKQSSGDFRNGARGNYCNRLRG